MTKWFFILGLFLYSTNVQAHQPDISTTMLVERENHQWLLQIRASLTAFQYEIKSQYPELEYGSPEEFQELVLQHVQKHLQISFNQEAAVVLQNGSVRLGHESQVFFDVVGVPQSINSVKVHNSSFEDIRHNQSALVILKTGFAKKQFILNEANQHTVELIAKDAAFALYAEKKANSFATSKYGLFVLLFFALGSINYMSYRWLKGNWNVQKKTKLVYK